MDHRNSREFHAGLVLFERGNFLAAIEAFQATLVYHPHHPETLSWIALCYLENKQPAKSIEFSRNSLAQDDTDPESWSVLGSALEESGELDEAITSFRKSLELRPNSAVTQSSLGWVLEKSGRTVEAVDAFQKAVRMDRSNPVMLRDLGAILAKTGEYGEAVKMFGQAIEIKPDDDCTLSHLAGSLIYLGKRDKAIETYVRALEINPNDPITLCNLGLAYHEVGRHDVAILTLKRSIAAFKEREDETDGSRNSASTRSKPQEHKARTLLHLGLTYFTVGRRREYRETYMESLKLKPDTVIDLRRRLKTGIDFELNAKHLDHVLWLTDRGMLIRIVALLSLNTREGPVRITYKLPKGKALREAVKALVFLSFSSRGLRNQIERFMY